MGQRKCKVGMTIYAVVLVGKIHLSTCWSYTKDTLLGIKFPNQGFGVAQRLLSSRMKILPQRKGSLYPLFRSPWCHLHYGACPLSKGSPHPPTRSLSPLHAKLNSRRLVGESHQSPKISAHKAYNGSSLLKPSIRLHHLAFLNSRPNLALITL